MLEGSRFAFLRSRNALIGIGAGLAAILLAVGLHLILQPNSPSAASPGESASETAAPSVPAVGAQTVSDANTVEVLTVLATTPTSSSAGAAANTAIDIRFNLPVDPATATSYFSVLPAVPGTFSQGPTPREIVFTPSGTFGLGASVNVVLRKGYSSRDGYALQGDYSFSFITAVSPGYVLFQVGDQVARVYSAPSGKPVTVQLQFGDGVPSSVPLETFRATAADLLAAQVHDATGAYLDQPIVTTGMQSVATADVTNGGTYTISQPDGIYLVLAADARGQYGALWLDFSQFGVILRGDDQKIVLAGEDLTTGATTPAFDVTFYSLLDGVQAVLTGTFTGTDEFPAPYPAPIDVAVATSGGEDVVIPLGVPQTGADLKVVGDLSTQPRIYLTTDRAGYQKGETVQFAGIVRVDNDQAYTVPVGMTVAVWYGYGDSKPVNEAAPVAADGTFSGSFAMPDAAFNADGSDAEMRLFAGTADQVITDFTPWSTIIGALATHTPAATVTVSFDKSTYVASDSVIATVTGVDGSGKALASKSVALTIYSAGYVARPSELDAFPAPNTWGLPVQDSVSVALDASGHATYTFKADIGQKAADQQVTLTASYGSGATAAIGARTATVYQAANEVFLLPLRTVYQPGDTVIAPFVVETRAGQRSAGVPVAFEIDATDYSGTSVTTTVVASGTVTTDASGLGTVHSAYSGPLGWLLLRVKGKDAGGNEFADSRSITVTDNLASLAMYSPSDSLLQMSVTADKIAYAVGDEAHLVVTSPIAGSVFLSLERGRVHQSRWITLAQGDNPLALTISPDLAPGFTLTLSYFNNGTYFTEGLPISVNNAERVLTVTVAPDKTSYAAGQTAHVIVTVTDGSGAPVEASLLVDGYDAAMSAYKLVDEESVAGAFLSPAVRGTNGSSSLVAIGSWGGRCGGGDAGPQSPVTNPGRAAVWLPDLTTDANGKVTVDVPIGQGSVRLVIFAATATTSLGQAQIDLNVP